MKTKLILSAAAILTAMSFNAQVSAVSSYVLNSIPIAGTDNCGFGGGVLAQANPGIGHTAFGINVLRVCTVGGQTGYNAGFGSNALYNTTTGFYNTACGTSVLGGNTTGSRNAALGTFALFGNTTGALNTAAGVNALDNNTVGDCNQALGYNADVSANNLSNATVIGCQALVNASDKVRIGNSAVTVVEGQVAYSFPSDGRFKTNVREDDVKGLAFIRLLRPVVYNFDSRKFQQFLVKDMPADKQESYLTNDFQRSTAVRQSGFIAQEVEKAAQQTGYDFNGIHHPESDKDNYSLAYSQFVVPLVKAVQEMDKQNSELKAQVIDLQKQVSDLSNAKAGSATGIGQTSAGTSGSMDQNEPNPFTNETVINYTLSEKVNSAYMAVYDLSGKQISTLPIIQKGASSITITSEKLAAGIYIYSIVADGKIMDSKRMIVANK